MASMIAGKAMSNPAVQKMAKDKMGAASAQMEPENLPYIESAPCNILAKIFLVPLSIAFWVLGACIWIALQLFRLAASPCLFPIFVQVMVLTAQKAAKDVASGKSAKEASANSRKTAGCGFNMVWGWFRLKSWNSEWLLSAPGKAWGASDGVWCVVESKSWMLRRELLEKKRSGSLSKDSDVEAAQD